MPTGSVATSTTGDLSVGEGYFAFGDAICYGRSAGREPARIPNDDIADVTHAVVCDQGTLGLPFDLSEVVVNLQRERYRQPSHHVLDNTTVGAMARGVYYFLRPVLPVPIRRQLQKIRFAGWKNITFPRWPVDTTIETLMERTLVHALRAAGHQPIPFIWFWPEGAGGCIMMTHDVEGPAGRSFCGKLMDLDDAFGLKSSFQIVPESSEGSWWSLADAIRRRGFEVNVHDLNHDGYLFHDRDQFWKRAERINRYVREFGCGGFRSGAMYREQQWYGAFDFSYDMSVPNVAHLEPQRGGCCTVMPYFVDHVLELPLTTTQDYSLFHILGEYSTTLWEQQIELILEKHGLISFIAHPDYLSEPRACAVYRDLLAYLSGLRDRRHLWTALPGEIDRWWRNRAAMSLVRVGDSWRIEGPGSERARLAWARLDDEGRLVYALPGNDE